MNRVFKEKPNKVVTIVDAALTDVGNEDTMPKKSKQKRHVKRKRKGKDPFEDDENTELQKLKDRFLRRYKKETNPKRDEVTVRRPTIKVVEDDLINLQVLHTKRYLRNMVLMYSVKTTALMKPSIYANEISMPNICALCQEPKGYKSLGELYGPYHIYVDQDNAWPPFMDDSVKPKRDGELYQVGLRIHCDCAIWAIGLKLVRHMVTGFQQTITKYWKRNCHECNCVGASITCAGESCSVAVHYPCASLCGKLDEKQFRFTCKSCLK